MRIISTGLKALVAVALVGSAFAASAAPVRHHRHYVRHPVHHHHYMHHPVRHVVVRGGR